jgi:hypothetical protein
LEARWYIVELVITGIVVGYLLLFNRGLLYSIGAGISDSVGSLSKLQKTTLQTTISYNNYPNPQAACSFNFTSDELYCFGNDSANMTHSWVLNITGYHDCGYGGCATLYNSTPRIGSGLLRFNATLPIDKNYTEYSINIVALTGPQNVAQEVASYSITCASNTNPNSPTYPCLWS